MKKFIIFLILLISVIEIVVFFFVNKKESKVETDNKHIQQTQTNKEDKEIEEQKQDTSSEIKEMKYGNTKIDIKSKNKEDRPIKTKVNLKNWQKKYYQDLTDNDINEMLEDYQTTSKGWQAGLGWFSSNFPNESKGWTSTEETKNGKINPKYVTLTDNSFKKMMAISLNRIVNPVFGGWEDSSLPIANDNAQENVGIIYNGLATQKYIKDISSDNPKNGKAIFNLGKNYGNKLKNSKSYRFGYIGNIKDFEITNNEKGYKVDLTIDYITSEGSVLETRKLKINYILDEQTKQLLIDSVEDNNQYNFDI